MARKIRYVLVATSHDFQWDGGAPSSEEQRFIRQLELSVRELVVRHDVDLIAEEAPHSLPTVACRVAEDLICSYLQVEPSECDLAGLTGLEDENARPQSTETTEFRLSRRDAEREGIWLDRVEGASPGTVLLVFGYAHARFLADAVRQRGHTVLGVFYVPEILSRRHVEPAP